MGRGDRQCQRILVWNSLQESDHLLRADEITFSVSVALYLRLAADLKARLVIGLESAVSIPEAFALPATISVASLRSLQDIR